MRLEPKPAAALCAAAFALLLIFGAAWPGPGLWLLAAALGCLAAAGATWWLDSSPAEARPAAQRVAHTPFAATPRRSGGSVGAGVSGMIGVRRAPDGRWVMPDRVHLAFVVGACGVLALILYIGGALGGGGEAAAPAVALEANPQVIDRSREGDPNAVLPAPAAPLVAPTTAGGAAAPAAATSPAAPPVSQARPIVVADPAPATPVELKPASAEAAAPPARTVQHTVVEGDTLYEIALNYESTVDAILALNGLTASDIIHPGDILLVPQPDE